MVQNDVCLKWLYALSTAPMGAQVGAAASAATLGAEAAAALTAHPALLAAIDMLASSGSTSPAANAPARVALLMFCRESARKYTGRPAQMTHRPRLGSTRVAAAEDTAQPGRG